MRLEEVISMVKGLSKLQKEILKIAYRNRGRMSEYGDVKNSEVLIEFYNFPANPPGHIIRVVSVNYLAG